MDNDKFILSGGQLTGEQANRFVKILQLGYSLTWYRRIWYFFLYRVLRKKPRKIEIIIHKDGE